MVRNEPFVYYAVKSVYDLARTILLYDTGSYDDYTLKDVHQLLCEDVDKKIAFEQVKIEVDETNWTTRPGPDNYHKMRSRNRGKRGKWWCRQKMIDDTETKFFMVLDGDEVYYRSSLGAIRRCLNDWPLGKVCGFVPLIWFYDLKHVYNRTSSGRLFLTEAIGMTKCSPSELHTVKATNQRIGASSKCSFHVSGIAPFAHFETALKPWRRNVHSFRLKKFTGSLPEVMLENTLYVERFLNESSR